MLGSSSRGGYVFVGSLGSTFAAADTLRKHCEISPIDRGALFHSAGWAARRRGLRPISIQRLRAAVFWDRRGAGAIRASGPPPSRVCSTAANEDLHLQRRLRIAIPRQRLGRGSAPEWAGHRYRPESPP